VYCSSKVQRKVQGVHEYKEIPGLGLTRTFCLVASRIYAGQTFPAGLVTNITVQQIVHSAVSRNFAVRIHAQPASRLTSSLNYYAPPGQHNSVNIRGHNISRNHVWYTLYPLLTSQYAAKCTLPSHYRRGIQYLFGGSYSKVSYTFWGKI
jgi:hypothetical protein